jgi:hypothetical protein
MNQREIFNARVKQLSPYTIEAEVFPDERAEFLAGEFLIKYGITHDQASSLFRDGSNFHTMIEHMYQEALAELRECDIATTGPAIQAQAQLLNLFLHIPIEIEEINSAPTLGRQHSADPQGPGA